MKRALIVLTITIILITIGMSVLGTRVYAAEGNITTVQKAEEPGALLELKQNQASTLEEYKQKYGSDSYGVVAYILHVVQIYSIPFCFLGIVIAVIYKVVIGRRHMENYEKGLGALIGMVTFTVICQVLPLIFAIVVKIGRE